MLEVEVSVSGGSVIFSNLSQDHGFIIIYRSKLQASAGSSLSRRFLQHHMRLRIFSCLFRGALCGAASRTR